MVLPMVTVEKPEIKASAIEVAVTFTCGGLGIVAGAIYFPAASTVPQASAVQPPPETLQVTTGTASKGTPTAFKLLYAVIQN